MNTIKETIQESTIRHKGYNQLFQPGKLTFGLVAPMKGYAQSPFPDMSDHEELVNKAEEVGIDAIWLRDVPFYDPGFGDAGQLYDPMVYAGWLAAKTKSIAIGTAGVVLPLRDPLLVAKQTLSLDHLTNGRFILGIAGGDRPTEYPAFGIEFENRAERYRDAVEVMKAVLKSDFPQHKSEYYGELTGNITMVPKPLSQDLPIINIGRARQSLSWIAENMDGWFWHGPQARDIPEVMDMWNRRNEAKFNPYGYAHFFDLDKNPDAPVHIFGNSLIGGRKALIDYWEMQKEQGLSHMLLNLKPSQRDAKEMLDEFGEHILPVFKG